MLAQLRQTTMMVSSNTALPFSAMKEHDMCTRNSWNNRSAIRKQKTRSSYTSHVWYSKSKWRSFSKTQGNTLYIGTAITLNVGGCALIGTLDTVKYFRQVYNIKIHLSVTSTATMTQQITHVHFRKNTWLQFSVTREPLPSFNDRSGQHTELRLSTRLRFW